MPVTINLRSIGNKVAGSKKFKKHTEQLVRNQVGQELRQALRQFDEHPVTVEINGGKESSNLSGTLNGKGNLFTFIGFTDGSNPITDVRNTLRNTVQFVRQKSFAKKRGQVKVHSKIKVPSRNLSDFDNVARRPATGGSWVKGIEQGIDGFGSYIYWREAGRSRGGLQAKTRQGKEQILRYESYEPTRYLTTIIENLVANIKSNKKVYDLKRPYF